ncbi:hypothetical protein HDU93_000401, partial [Gonapodya sp. JEL0774]
MDFFVIPDTLVDFVTTTPLPLVVLIILGWTIGLLVLAYPDRGLFTSAGTEEGGRGGKIRTAEGSGVWGNAWRLGEDELTLPFHQLFFTTSQTDLSRVLEDATALGKPNWYIRACERVYGRGLANVNGKEWEGKRAIWDAPAAGDLAPDPHTLDLAPLLTRVTLDLTLRAALGTSPIEPSPAMGYPLTTESHPVLTSLANLCAELDHRTLFWSVWPSAEILPWWKGFGRGGRIERECKVVEAWLEEALGAEYDKVQDGSVGWIGEWYKAHTLAIGSPPTKADTRDAIFNFIFEAYPPLLNASLWSVWCVAKTPEQAVALHKELDAEKGKGKKFAKESKTARNIILESLRLFPPHPTVHREVLQSTPLILPHTRAGVLPGDFVAHHLYTTGRIVGKKGEDEDGLFGVVPERWDGEERKKTGVQ